jgi:hypothetical protein
MALLVPPATAADLAGPSVTKSAPAPASWWDTFAISGHVEAGVTFNAASPPDNINFGHLFTDRANTVLLNQVLLTAQRPLDPKATGYDFGFKFQAMYGSDARYTHFLGEFDYSINARNQFDIVEAHALFHLPWLTKGGIDLKIGQYVTLEGVQVISAPDNLLYSHSYIFNFGIPFKHTGVMTTTHVNETVDIYAGIDSGVNTTFGNQGFPSRSNGDNNRAVAFHGGLGLNLLDGALTLLGTTHIGPELPQDSRDLRYLNDLTITWKVNDKFTLQSDLNYIRDDGLKANGYGIAQYAAYAINDWLKFVLRGEVWRDAQGAFVAAFPGNFDFVNAELGLPNGAFGGGRTTYGAITAGLNITPTLPKDTTFIKAIIFRPEVRYDASLSGTTPFAAGTKSSQFTFGGDIIVKF